MNSSTASGLRAALPAAQAAAGAQHYPRAALYVVATPIGNLADITLRALHVLALADAVACEDTRHTRQLLQSYGIHPPALLSAHQHNEAEAAQAVLTRLARGERVALVSDAGTPAVSDPGARLVAAVRAAGHAVLPLPGASSATAVLSAAGAVSDAGGFVFAGFLGAKAGERQAALQRLRSEPRPVVVLEAPHRIAALAAELTTLGARAVTLGRELSKQFEQIVTLPAQDLPAWLAADEQRRRGEFALVLHPLAGEPAQAQAQTLPPAQVQPAELLRLLLAHLPLKTAAQVAAQATGHSRKALYALGLQIREE